MIKACGPSGWIPSGWINDLCDELGLKTLLCSTNEEAWRWNSVKRKTDKDDALKLARLAMMKQLKPVHIPKHEVREHRTLVKCRKSLDQRINRVKNAIRSLFAHRDIDSDSGKPAWRPGRELINKFRTSPRRRTLPVRAEYQLTPQCDSTKRKIGKNSRVSTPIHDANTNSTNIWPDRTRRLTRDNANQSP